MEQILTQTSRLLPLSIYFFTAAAAIEAVWHLFVRKREGRDVKETLANVGVVAVRQVLRSTVLAGLFVGILTWVAQFRIATIPLNGWTVVFTILLADFIYYWNHRASHEVRYFWSYHSVHHSSKEYNLSTAIRLPWLGTISDTMFYVPAVLLGVNPLALAVGKGLVLVYQFWIHTESIGRLGPLEGVLNTPSAHRVHHASNPRLLDRNHGGILMIWDRLFGTYAIEDEKIVYGLTTPIGTYDPFTINFKEPLAMARDAWSARSLKGALMVLAKGPAWKPPVALAMPSGDLSAESAAG